MKRTIYSMAILVFFASYLSAAEPRDLTKHIERVVARPPIVGLQAVQAMEDVVIDNCLVGNTNTASFIIDNFDEVQDVHFSFIDVSQGDLGPIIGKASVYPNPALATVPTGEKMLDPKGPCYVTIKIPAVDRVKIMLALPQKYNPWLKKLVESKGEVYSWEPKIHTMYLTRGELLALRRINVNQHGIYFKNFAEETFNNMSFHKKSDR